MPNVLAIGGLRRRSPRQDHAIPFALGGKIVNRTRKLQGRRQWRTRSTASCECQEWSEKQSEKASL